MRFTAGLIDSLKNDPSVALAFEIQSNRLIAVESGAEPFDVVVQRFDPTRDLFYRTPETLSADDLAEEIPIHIPSAIATSIAIRPVAGMLRNGVLIQQVSAKYIALPLLTVLKKILTGVETVNSALLYAEQGGIVYVRNAGNDYYGGATAHSLKEFFALRNDEREEIFPDIHASDIIVIGEESQRIDLREISPFSSSRVIAISDFEPLCQFSTEAAQMVAQNPNLFVLAIGAAAVYAEIMELNGTIDR